ncbi:MAG: oxidoreductase [Firmicutes bacterium]|nr:oxidoreductase [Bacillota bacterium]
MSYVYSITAKELVEKGRDNIPNELQSSKHLIYSSPATLSFNSPGAQGFGVKRAGLAIPGSVMLLVAPVCCGRNTQALAAPDGFGERFFFLLQDDTDIVTGRHLNKISKAVKEVVDSLETPPSVVMICITCVDALLGTDMDRVCKKASEYVGIPVLPCYMYALTREGKLPPMVLVRKTLYSLLEKKPRKKNVVNILGEFAPFQDNELFEILKGFGIQRIHEISKCKDFEDYKTMAEANFNIILNPEARHVADDMKKRLGIPSIEMTRVYQIDKIHKQYELFGSALGVSIDDTKYYEEAMKVIEQFNTLYPNTSFALGEWCNADPFELALALLRYGHQVKEIYGTITNVNYVYIKKIAQISPNTKIFTNLSPTMLNFNCKESEVDLSIGKDAAYYHPECPNIPWNEDNKPFGYAGLKELFTRLLEAKKGE